MHFLNVHSASRALLLVVASWVLAVPLATASEEITSPEIVLENYLRALYARDTDTAYALLSRLDQAEKSLEHYRDENGSFSTAALTLSKQLSQSISIDELDLAFTGDRAVATLAVTLPNANDQSLKKIVSGFDARQLSKLSASELESRRTQLQALADTGKLPVIQSTGEQWELVRENGQWRVLENWLDSIVVEFDSIVMGELGWQFEPLRTHVLASPGQTVAMAYRATNIGPTATTGKARHIIGPDADASHLEIVSCFCFLEQTLAPGEEIEMPMVFRVDFEAPESIRAFDILYEFYPIEEFPADEAT